LRATIEKGVHRPQNLCNSSLLDSAHDSIVTISISVFE
jgi:hypothetical protein